MIKYLDCDQKRSASLIFAFESADAVQRAFLTQGTWSGDCRLRRPLIGGRRHQDRGMEQSPRHRHRRARAAQEYDARRDAELRRQRLRLPQPRRVRDALGSPRHPLHRNHARRESREDHQRAQHPDAEENRRP